MEAQKEDATRKIHKCENDLVNTEKDLEKKKEAIRDTEAKMKILE